MPSFHEVFAQAAGTGGTLPFDRFCELALYHPQVGYYRRDRPRVGRLPGTDFHTSASSNPVFGTLVAAACANLVGPAAAEHVFVEIGAETHASVLDGIPHPFREVRTIRIGEPLRIDGPCIVFSNELFDAQPFVRLVFRAGAWRERGVQLANDALTIVEMPEPRSDTAELIARLPTTPGEAYELDISPAAARLAGRVAAQPWTGLFVAFDYGRSWRELTEDSPAGTARAYRAHRQHNDLLADPGEQDLTCHVCWDEIIAAIARRGFRDETIESQEAFFIRHAGEAVEAIVTGTPRGPDPMRLQLQQLIHPTLMGQKFQVLTARRSF
ncbi:MAG TPA: SAM-dependent methyltransferase [Opitutaceae bacterium]|nr:SAM-dependent methyltransferase [Opitutaceae bacterium]